MPPATPAPFRAASPPATKGNARSPGCGHPPLRAQALATTGLQPTEGAREGGARTSQRRGSSRCQRVSGSGSLPPDLFPSQPAAPGRQRPDSSGRGAGEAPGAAAAAKGRRERDREGGERGDGRQRGKRQTGTAKAHRLEEDPLRGGAWRRGEGEASMRLARCRAGKGGGARRPGDGSPRPPCVPSRVPPPPPDPDPDPPTYPAPRRPRPAPRRAAASCQTCWQRPASGAAAAPRAAR